MVFFVFSWLSVFNHEYFIRPLQNFCYLAGKLFCLLVILPISVLFFNGEKMSVSVLANKISINYSRGVLSAMGIALAVAMTPVVSSATEQNMALSTDTFVLKLGASRVIYDAASNGATLSVINQQNYPMLVRSTVLAEDKKTPAPFVVTPPLFRLDGQQQSRLRIVRTGGQLADDRESLQWLCVTGIPPKNDDQWAAGEDGKSQAPAKKVAVNVQVSVQNCIKLLVRPKGIKAPTLNEADALVWSRSGGKLNAKNPTPYYINLSSLTVGGKAVPGIEYVPPFSSRSFALPAGAAGQVQWRAIDDLGGESKVYQAALK
ncbi:fimbria/pilus periplasmic chaperone [Serratia sp. AKBS12]|uniref:fimbria/pilus periplasmic chaperone n=1 Tax=Serratia sp. AKBS12 TaxID=2974597 RepID=UPI00286C7677|nr:fimbria/pilus periplasmic chaperone [Serratia sp. AKBS12]